MNDEVDQEKRHVGDPEKEQEHPDLITSRDDSAVGLRIVLDVVGCVHSSSGRRMGRRGVDRRCARRGLCDWDPILLRCQSHCQRQHPR